MAKTLRLIYWLVLINVNRSGTNISTVLIFNDKKRVYIYHDDGNLRQFNTLMKKGPRVKTLTHSELDFLPNGPEFISFRVLMGQGRSFENGRERAVCVYSSVSCRIQMKLLINSIIQMLTVRIVNLINIFICVCETCSACIWCKIAQFARQCRPFRIFINKYFPINKIGSKIIHISLQFRQVSIARPVYQCREFSKTLSLKMAEDGTAPKMELATREPLSYTVRCCFIKAFVITDSWHSILGIDQPNKQFEPDPAF